MLRLDALMTRILKAVPADVTKVGLQPDNQWTIPPDHPFLSRLRLRSHPQNHEAIAPRANLLFYDTSSHTALDLYFLGFPSPGNKRV